MTIIPFVSELRALGVKFEAVEGRLRVDAPRGVLKEHHRAFLTRHKSSLLGLAILGSGAGDGADGGQATHMPAEVAALGSEAIEHFLDRLGRADEQGMDAAPGSEAWCTSLREAKRIAAGLPPAPARNRQPDILDAALEVFAAPGVRLTARRMTPDEVAQLRLPAEEGGPPKCRMCGRRSWWRFPGQGGWTCDSCHPAFYRDLVEFLEEDGGPTQ